MKPANRSTLFLALLTVGVSSIAIVSVRNQWASNLEGFCFATGAVCVWLVVRENIWNFPLGILNVSGYAIVFFQANLYADAGLQIVYCILGFAGWTMWLRGVKMDKGKTKQLQPISRISRTELTALMVIVFVATLSLWRTLHWVGGSASFWDALTTSISLASQWMLNRKQLENWIGWIIVDFIYVPLYLYKELYLTSVLYAVFLCMAIVGLIEWHRKYYSHGLEVLNPS